MMSQPQFRSNKDTVKVKTSASWRLRHRSVVSPIARPLQATPPRRPPSYLQFLLQDMPQIIRVAAGRKGIPLPAEPSVLVRCMMGGPRLDPVWPQFPPVSPYLSEAASDPSQMKAPVDRYVSITRVSGQTDKGFPAVAPLESTFLSFLRYEGLRPLPPSGADKTTIKLTHRAHQCAAQSGAAVNNICLLVSSLEALVSQPDLLPPDVSTEVRKVSAVILALSSCLAVATSRIMAWQTMIQRNVWLSLSTFSGPEKNALLGGPISPDGLFGPGLAEMMKIKEEAEIMRRFLFPKTQRETR